jgi:hypothetical protein
MKRLQMQQPRRARAASGAVARSSKDAAIHLVRLEFDAARLEQGIAQAEHRAQRYRMELARNIEQRAPLMALLTR